MAYQLSVFIQNCPPLSLPLLRGTLVHLPNIGDGLNKEVPLKAEQAPSSMVLQMLKAAPLVV
jgi:hypothetical protein